MGERGQGHAPLKTVTEFRSKNEPEDVQISHTSETGEEPVYVNEETFVSEEKIETGQVQYREESKHKLDELARDFYLFSLAPVYLTCLWDRLRNQIKFDLLYRFAREMKTVGAPRVIHYSSPVPILNWTGDVWDHLLQGLPRAENVEYIFPKWVEQLVFVDREARPMQYWRVNTKIVKVMAPQIAATPVEVAVFVPTGVDKQLDLRVRPDGSYDFIQLKPEEWVIEEAMRYFGGVDA